MKNSHFDRTLRYFNGLTFCMREMVLMIIVITASLRFVCCFGYLLYLLSSNSRTRVALQYVSPIKMTQHTKFCKNGEHETCKECSVFLACTKKQNIGNLLIISGKSSHYSPTYEPICNSQLRNFKCYLYIYPAPFVSS